MPDKPQTNKPEPLSLHPQTNQLLTALKACYGSLTDWMEIADEEDHRGRDYHALDLAREAFQSVTGNSIDEAQGIDTPESYHQYDGDRKEADEEEALFDIRYCCHQCGAFWESVDTAACDDECGGCGEEHIEPLMFKGVGELWSSEQEKQWEALQDDE